MSEQTEMGIVHDDQSDKTHFTADKQQTPPDRKLPRQPESKGNSDKLRSPGPKWHDRIQTR